MNRQEFEEAARKYREEMFRLYAARQFNPPPAPQQPAPPVPPKPPLPPSPPRNPHVPHHPPVRPPMMPQRPPLTPPPPFAALPALSDGQEQPAETESPQESTTPENAPPEDIAYLPENPPQEPDGSGTDDAGAVKPDASGGILVHVRTARGAEPVPGAAVVITQEQNGEQILISVQTTNECGDVPEVSVPAPPSTADQQYPAYYVYDISVSAEGFYREHSKDVPVFEGVVSVQSFDLIPLPAGHDDPYTGSRTHYNNLPGI